MFRWGGIGYILMVKIGSTQTSVVEQIQVGSQTVKGYYTVTSLVKS